MNRIDFNDQVAIVTGAGQGLGKAYANLLASRGACVVVNDYGRGADGEFLARQTVREITANGGQAVVSLDDMAKKESSARLAQTALEQFGGIDILIHNAGILGRKPLLEMDDEDWHSVLDVHLNGAYYLLKQVLPYMVKQKYGRIVMITSSAGLFGLSGQASYATAKMGVVGLVQALKTEIEDLNIRCNLVSPLAVTNQTAYAIGRHLQDEYPPEFVAPVVAYLCARQCMCNGYIYVAGGGYFSRIGLYEGKGIYIDKEHLCIEAVAERINEISDLTHGVHISSMNQAAKKLFKSVLLKGQSKHVQ